MFTTLSILVYLAESVERFSTVACGVGIAAIVAACISAIILFCCSAEGEVDWSKSFNKKWLKYTIIAAILGTLFLFVSSLVPTKKAVYMIAGIQAAEYLSQTETAKEISNEGIKIFKDVGTIIHSYATEAVSTVKEKVTDGAKEAVETTDKAVEAVKDSATAVVKETIKETIKE
jgi:hypothetical protein